MVDRSRRVSVPPITDAEWDVMDALWSRQTPATAGEVIDSLARRRSWSPRTVKTLLGRLVKKRALAFTVEGNRYLYRAAVAREACVWQQSRSFLARVFAGRAGEMLCRFVDEVDLSRDELDALRALLDKKRGKR